LDSSKSLPLLLLQMTKYELHINFKNAGLDLLHATNEKVTIVKGVQSDSVSIPTVWISFKPAEYNKITWTEDYGLYASFTSVKAGSTVTGNSFTRAFPGCLYTFNDSFYFNDPTLVSPDESTNAYYIKNSSKEMFSFGLTQDVTVDSNIVTTYLNAAMVPNGQSAEFTPTQNLLVFVHASLDNGVILTDVTSKATVVPFTPTTKSQTLKFYEANSTFLLSV